MLQVTGGVSVPDSVALPFGSFERVLEDPCNSDAALGISACMEDLEVGLPAVSISINNRAPVSLGFWKGTSFPQHPLVGSGEPQVTQEKRGPHT